MLLAVSASKLNVVKCENEISDDAVLCWRTELMNYLQYVQFVTFKFELHLLYDKLLCVNVF